jgi:hypothetical protein
MFEQVHAITSLTHLIQAAYTLTNLSNGSQEHQDQILAHAGILSALRSCLVDAPMDVRRAAVACVLQLARGGGARHVALHGAGVVGTLRHICDNSATMSHSTGPGHVAVERAVREDARMALDYIEHGVALDRTP